MSEISLTNMDVEQQQTTGSSLLDTWNNNVQRSEIKKSYKIEGLVIATMIMASGITPIQLPRTNDTSILKLCDVLEESPIKKIYDGDDILIESPRIAEAEAKELMKRNFVRVNDPRKNKSV